MRRAEIVMRVVIERLPKLRRRGRTTQPAAIFACARQVSRRHVVQPAGNAALVYGTSLSSGPELGTGHS